MKVTIYVMIIFLGGLMGVETAMAGWSFPIPRNLRQLGAACDDYYVAGTEDHRQEHLKRASDVLTRIKTEDRITEEKMIATLRKYKTIKPKLVAFVILALATCKPNELEVVYKTMATLRAVEWANDVVLLSSAK